MGEGTGRLSIYIRNRFGKAFTSEGIMWINPVQIYTGIGGNKQF